MRAGPVVRRQVDGPHGADHGGAQSRRESDRRTPASYDSDHVAVVEGTLVQGFCHRQTAAYPRCGAGRGAARGRGGRCGGPALANVHGPGARAPRRPRPGRIHHRRAPGGPRDRRAAGIGGGGNGAVRRVLHPAAERQDPRRGRLPRTANLLVGQHRVGDRGGPAHPADPVRRLRAHALAVPAAGPVDRGDHRDRGGILVALGRDHCTGRRDRSAAHRELALVGHLAGGHGALAPARCRDGPRLGRHRPRHCRQLADHPPVRRRVLRGRARRGDRARAARWLARRAGPAPLFGGGHGGDRRARADRDHQRAGPSAPRRPADLDLRAADCGQSVVPGTVGGVRAGGAPTHHQPHRGNVGQRPGGPRNAAANRTGRNGDHGGHAGPVGLARPHPTTGTALRAHPAGVAAGF